MNPEKVGKFLKELRESKKISQYKLADIMHIDRTLVSKWENGKICPDQKYFEDLCKIYEIDVKELIEGERATEENEEELKRGIFRFFDFQDKKYKKARRFSIGLIISLVTIIITFLAYYFYQTYNTIRIFRIYGSSDKYEITEGLLVMTRDKSYLNVGEINKDYDKLTIYYLKGSLKIIIYEGEESKLVYSLATTNDGLDYDNFDDNKDYIFVDITSNDKVETIQLHFDNEYVNKSFLFNDYKDGYNVITNYNEENIIPKFINENFECEEDTCRLLGKDYEYTYNVQLKILYYLNNKNTYNFEYNFETNQLKYSSKKYTFISNNNIINCSKPNCDKEKEIYDEIFEKFLKPILQ